MNRFFHVFGCVWIGVLFVSLVLPAGWIWPAAALLLIGGAGLLRKNRPPLWLWAAAAAFLFSCISLFTYNAAVLEPALCLQDEPFTIRALTISVEKSGKMEGAVMRVLPVPESPRPLWNRHVRLFQADGLDVGPGDVIEYTGNFYNNPERRADLAANEILLESLVENKGALSVQEEKIWDWHVTLSLWRDALRKNLIRALPMGEGEQLAQMLLGDGESLDFAQRREWNRSGISHMMAVSGLHLAILAGILDAILRLFGMSPRRKAVIFCAGVFLFMGLAGFGASVTRAGLMAIFCKSGLLLGRDSDPLNLLGFSASVMLAMNPYILLKTGFQLSYLSTLGILLFEKPLSDWTARRLTGRDCRDLRWPGTLISSVCVTFTATLLTIPVLCRVFGQVSIVAPLTNLLAAPLAFLAIGGGMGCALLGFSGMLEIVWRAAALAAGLAIKALNALAGFFGGFSWAAVPVHQDWQHIWIVAAIVTGLLLWTFHAGKRVVSWSALLLAVCCAGGALSFSVFWGTPLLLGVMDSGCTVLIWQGQAALIGLPQGVYETQSLRACLEEEGVDSICLAVARDSLDFLDEYAGKLLSDFQAQNSFSLSETQLFHGELFGWVALEGNGGGDPLIRLRAGDYEIVKSFAMRPEAAHILINKRNEMLFAKGVSLPVNDRYNHCVLAALPGPE